MFATALVYLGYWSGMQAGLWGCPAQSRICLVGVPRKPTGRCSGSHICLSIPTYMFATAHKTHMWHTTVNKINSYTSDLAGGSWGTPIRPPRRAVLGHLHLCKTKKEQQAGAPLLNLTRNCSLCLFHIDIVSCSCTRLGTDEEVDDAGLDVVEQGQVLRQREAHIHKKARKASDVMERAHHSRAPNTTRSMRSPHRTCRSSARHTTTHLIN
jgi:hypothetical protein